MTATVEEFARERPAKSRKGKKDRSPSDALTEAIRVSWPGGWEAWQRHLGCRKAPPRIQKLFRGEFHPLLWGLPESVEHAPLAKILAAAGQESKSASRNKHVSESIDRWLASSDVNLVTASQSMCCAYSLVDLALHWTESKWNKVVERLIHLGNVISAPAGESRTSRNHADRFILWQWLSGEAPQVLAYQFPEVPALSDLQDQAYRCSSSGLADFVDGQGLLHASQWPNLRALLASWTRRRMLAAKMRQQPWSAKAEQQYQYLIREALRISRADGSQALGPGLPEKSWGDWLPHLVRQSTTSGTKRLADAVLSKTDSTISRRRVEAANESEWAEAAVLWTGWSARSPRLAINYDGGVVRSELSADLRVIWSGDFVTSLSIDGISRPLSNPWRQVCWESDEEVDYLELETQVTEHTRMQRQMLLARRDQLLFFSDVVLGDFPKQWDYRLSIPLHPQFQFAPEEKTREAWLAKGSQRYRILPLAFPEWRSARAAGELTGHGAALRYEIAAAGKRLYAPLLLDLDSSRKKQEATWRIITIAQDRELVPRDEAAGYRFQIGRKQWLVYRSLTPQASRTVLGQNLVTEFFFGRFLPNGTTQAVIEIE